MVAFRSCCVWLHDGNSPAPRGELANLREFMPEFPRRLSGQHGVGRVLERSKEPLDLTMVRQESLAEEEVMK
jgi:hypothetical protein